MKPLFSVPDRGYGPAPWWAWMGDPTPDRMDRQLRRFLDMRVFEVIIIPLYGLVPEYLGTRYFELYRHACRRCRQWKIKLWIYDEFNWPSGTCAGRVLRDFPEARQQLIQFSWPGSAYGGGAPTWRVAPYGGFDLASYGASWALATTGYVDVLSAPAVRRFIGLTMERYREELGGYFGDVIVGFFTDEPAISHGGPQFPYTPGLFGQFKARYGYDLEPRVTDLVVDSPGALKVRRDYWALVNGLFQHNFFRQYAGWCARHGLKMTGHLLLEELLSSNIRYSGNLPADLAEMQVPGMDLLQGATSFDTQGPLFVGEKGLADIGCRLLDSAACFSGRQRTLCEAFGCVPYSSTARFYKRATDFLMHHGLSMINDNLFVDSLSSFRKFCGCHAFRTPWTRHYGRLARHMQTLSYLNAGATLETELGVYYPGLDAFARFGNPGTWIHQWRNYLDYRDPGWQQTQRIIAHITHGLIRRQWNFYFLFDEVLQQAAAAGGALKVRSFACRALILPGIRFLPPDVAETLSKFLASGGTIVSLGEAPSILAEDGAVRPWRRPRTARFIRLDGAPDEVLPALDKLLRARVRPAARLEGRGADQVMATRRRSRGREFLLLTHFGTETADLSLSLPGAWTEIDTVTRAPLGAPGARLVLRPDETRLLIKRKAASARRAAALPADAVTLAPEWRLRLPGGNTHALALNLYRGPSRPDAPADFSEQRWHPAAIESAPVPLEPGRPYWLTRRLVAEHRPAALRLVTDGEDGCAVFWNGKRLHLLPARPALWDEENRACDLLPALRPGDNTLLVRYTPAEIRRHVSRIVPLTDLPAFVLAGDFRARDLLPMQATALMALPDRVLTGALHLQDLGHFTGVAEYSQDVELAAVDRNAVLDLGHQTDLFEVSINGRDLGVAAWPPHRLPAGRALRRGRNRIVLRLVTALGILSRNYRGVEAEKPPIGLLDQPRLLGCRAP